MSFADHKITAFTHRITDLPDQPTLSSQELKARFDSSPEELRKAHNAVCDEGERLSARVEGIVTDTFGDTIDREMLSHELAAELDAKADEASVAKRLTSEQTARENADAALQSTLLQRCEVYIGTYVGLSTENNSGTVNVPQTITLGFRPKAVLIFTQGGETSTGNSYVRGGLCLDGCPIGGSRNGAYIIDEGFVAESPDKNLKLNGLGMTYYYIAFKQAA